ncbi:MAG: hypothetical protein N2662_06320 [Bacteroidales bacterium]|nr:hypothetical protein [Bacteroidales bacterium]
MKKIMMFITLGFFACQQKPENISIVRNQVMLDTLSFVAIADTIIADMVVKNPDTADWWTEKCLRRLKRESFVDTIFQQLYRKQLVAYDYYTNKPLSTSQIKEIERREDFNRNIVGKFQFYEGWYYDVQNKVFIKKVYAIIFGYETYDDKGMVKGYKPMFKVLFQD